MHNQFLKHYVEKSMGSIEGFCPVQTMFVLDWLDQLFPSDHKSVAEIGVHHGQLFIALNQLASERSYAIDVFGDQHLNIDNSGQGNYEKFLQNLMTHDARNGGKNVEIRQGDSLDRDTFIGMTRCDYISVDGGHTPAHVISDLAVASWMMKPNGVVILDDYFNHWWPSVTEGLMKFLYQATPTLVPFCSSANKMWMCSLSYKDTFYNHMKSIDGFGKTETVFMGHKIVDLW